MCNHPEDINKYLNYGEKVYYTGNYDILAITNNGDTNTVQCNISSNACGYNLCVSRFAYCSDVFKANVKFLWEQYTICSFDYSLLYREGQIDFQSLYPDTGDLGVTANNIQVFNVDSGTGIYKNVHKVLVDYRNPVRNLYFVGYGDFFPN